MVDYLTYYYRKGAEPFRSLSVLPDADAIHVMESLYVEGAVIWERFKNPAQYLWLRRQVEQWLHTAFIAKGGDPQDPCPIYTMLGTPAWVLKMGDAASAATTSEMRIPLSIFRDCDVSFTYPDSMVSWLMEQEKNPEYYQPGYHGQVFTLSEIRSIIEAKGMPEEGWETKMPATFAHYVEAQVWNQKPLMEYKSQLLLQETLR